MLTGGLQGIHGAGRLEVGLSENEIARLRRILRSEELLPQAHKLIVGDFFLSLNKKKKKIMR